MLQIDGFGDVVERSARQRSLSEGGVRCATDHDDFHSGRYGLDRDQGVRPREAWHSDVEEHHVRRVLHDGPEGVGPARDAPDGVSL